ncbi:MAG: hypothetical protein DRO99_04900 [Candidatus Aenigmatarchaeota archaeon]|nr:MAG: hypothetical protein DRO99_04900 [Candidatus Aenigmarchaeota archaeon]
MGIQINRPGSFGNEVYSNDIYANIKGFHLGAGASDNRIHDNTIVNNGWGIGSWEGRNNIFSSNVIDGNEYGIVFFATNNSKVIDTNVTDSSIGSVYLYGRSTNNTFLNVSYESDTVRENSQLIRQWYVDVNVTKHGLPLGGANATMKNSSGYASYSGMTSSSVLMGVARFNATEYVNNNGDDGGSVDYWTPYTVEAFRPTKGEGKKVENFSFNAMIDLPLLASPIVRLVSPSNDSRIYTTKPNMVFNVTDIIHNSLDCVLYLNGVEFGGITASNATAEKLKPSNQLSRGTYYWQLNCTDPAGNWNVSQVWYLQIIGHTVQVILNMDNVDNDVFVPGTGTIPSSAITNRTYESPVNWYIASFLNNVLNALVLQSGNPSQIQLNGSDGAHYMTMSSDVENSNIFLVFTEGDKGTVDSRIDMIESGDFLSEIVPSFAYGLGTEYVIKILLGYSKLDIISDLILQKGYHKLSIEKTGKTGSKNTIQVTVE